MNKKIVVVGAGYAGVLTAKKLAKRFKKHEDVSITIIDRNPFHTMLTELHEVAAGRVEEDAIKISLDKVFAGRRVDVRLDTVTKIDFEGRVVEGEVQNYAYDYLVLAAGCKPAFFGVEGAQEFTYKLWSYEDAIRLRKHIHDCFHKASLETDPTEKAKLLSFYIIGAGFTGVEMAGELGEYAPVLCRSYGIDPALVKIHNVDVLPHPVPNLPTKLSEKIERRMQKMNINLVMNTSVAGVGEDYIELSSNGAVNRFSTKSVIWAAGIQGADIAEEAGKSLKSTARARIETDEYLRSVSNENVFVVGDNIMFVPKGDKGPVPQMVENCEQSSATAAHNLACALSGEGTMRTYTPSFHGVMVSVGGRYGVARVGTSKFMMNLPSFLAMFVKHFINIVYFMQVLGWNKVFSYIRHEFFTIRNDRSFVGGHLSNKTPSFLLMPLRVWLGAVWIFEGVKKVVEGWLVTPNLNGFFGGANAWYASLLGTPAADATTAATGVAEAATAATGVVSEVVSAATSAAAEVVSAATGVVAEVASAATGVVEAVSAATGVAEAASAATGAVSAAAASVGEVFINFNFLGLFRVLFVSGKSLASSALNDFAFRLQVPLMDWFINTFLLPYDSVQLFMQIFIVVAEIAIGLCLIGGLFTTPASALSLILQFMFVCTTGLYLGTVWMVFAAIAVLIGGGRTLGLDYYAMPYLKKQWKKIPLVRKLYIYHD